MSIDISIKNKALALRKKGMSYNAIRKALNLTSKGTLSHWFKGLTLSKTSVRLLEHNRKIAYQRGLFTANKQRTARIEKENAAAFLEGRTSIKEISPLLLATIGVALYWGEGTKSEHRQNKSLSFSNADPSMIAVYLRFIREILNVPEDKIRAGIHIYPNTPEEKARLFWSKITKLPPDRFYIVTQISRSSAGKRPTNTLPYGTAVIRVNNRIQFYKVLGMIRGIIDQAGIKVV